MLNEDIGVLVVLALIVGGIYLIYDDVIETGKRRTKLYNECAAKCCPLVPYHFGQGNCTCNTKVVFPNTQCKGDPK